MPLLDSFLRRLARNPAPHQPSRLQAALRAREEAGEDFFGGWEPSDLELFARYAQPSEPVAGRITDFLGIRTAAELHPWAAHLAGRVIAEPPIPDDCLRAEAIEYYALLSSIEIASPGAFTMAELGASYGPWLCAGAVLAARTGRTRLRLVALEASSLFLPLLPRHLRENGIDPERVELRLIRGALAAERGYVRFPKLENPGQNGARVQGDSSDGDGGAGAIEEYEDVEAFTLADVLPEGVSDYVHIDVQGAEACLLDADPELLNSRIRSLFIGTHSRKIEGELLEYLSKIGWILRRERPTRFAFNANQPESIDWTTRDGGQYWINPNLVRPRP